MFFTVDSYKTIVKCMTYNQSPYIEDTLNGFSMQQTDFPFVCVIMDDASTDGEQDLLRLYIDRECDVEKVQYYKIDEAEIVVAPHITNTNCCFAFYFLKQNLYGTRKKQPLVNKWEEKCEYVAICEGDDYWTDPLKLQKQVDLLERFPDASFCCGGNIWRQKGRADIDKTIYRDNEPFFSFNLSDYLSESWFTQPLTMMWRVSLDKQLQEISKGFSYWRDNHVIFYLLKNGDGLYLSEVLGIYNLHEGGVASMISQKQRARVAYQIWRELYLAEGGELLRKKWYYSILYKLDNPEQFSDIRIVKEGLEISRTFKQFIIILKHGVTMFTRLL